MTTYHTAEIAAMLGIHANTVRFYEAQGLLSPVPRKANGYRVYTKRHLLQLRLIRLALRAEILSEGLRAQVFELLKASAASRYGEAIAQTKGYQAQLEAELGRARQALALAAQLLRGEEAQAPEKVRGRRKAAAQIGVSVDVLRDWERNGLVQVPGSPGRRQYGLREMNRLKIILILRHAHYSQMSIRRMLAKLEGGETDLLQGIDTPEPTEDIVSVADRYITSLSGALADTAPMLALLQAMKRLA